MSIFISGPAIQLNRINANGWGIRAGDAGPVIEALKAGVIRVCSRDDPHGCDLQEDPYAEIGRITDAWQDADWIYAKGEITDPAAIQKIEAGVWEKNWSTFGYEAGSDNGWSIGFTPRSMTLVRFPAWENASWGIVAAAKGFKALAPLDYSFSVKSSSVKKCSCKNNKRVGNMVNDKPDTGGPDGPGGEPGAGDGEPGKGQGEPGPGAGEGEPGQGGESLEEKLARLETELTTLKAESSKKEGELTTATASLKEKDQKLGELNRAIAEHEKYKAASIPLDKHQEIVQESNKNAVAAAKAEEERAAALAEYAGIMEKHGIPVNEEDFSHLSAADIKKSIANAEKLIQVASKKPNYAAGSNTGSTVGAWNSTTKKWE